MPAQIFFGAGSLDNLGSAPLPGTKALIVIGGTSVKRLGYLDRVQALLKKQGVESVVFDKVQPRGGACDGSRLPGQGNGV